MKVETNKVLEKTQIRNEAQMNAMTIGCCGGGPLNNQDACCKLDEDKKAEGTSGCGCNTTAIHKKGSGCC